jgi:hypothetical protein
MLPTIKEQVAPVDVAGAHGRMLITGLTKQSIRRSGAILCRSRSWSLNAKWHELDALCHFLKRLPSHILSYFSY